MYYFSVDHDAINIIDITDIQNYLMKRNIIYECLDLLNKHLLYFVGLSATKQVSPKNQPCTVRQTPVDLNLDELHYYPFTFRLERYD